MGEALVLRRVDEAGRRFPAEIRWVGGELLFCAWSEVLRRVRVGSGPGEVFELRRIIGVRSQPTSLILADVDGYTVASFDECVNVYHPCFWGSQEAVVEFFRKVGLRIHPSAGPAREGSFSAALALDRDVVSQDVKSYGRRRPKELRPPRRSFPPADPALSGYWVMQELLVAVLAVLLWWTPLRLVPLIAAVPVFVRGVVRWRRDVARAEGPLP